MAIIFAAFPILTGKEIGTCPARHLGREFVQPIQQLERNILTRLEIHLIVEVR